MGVTTPASSTSKSGSPSPSGRPRRAATDGTSAGVRPGLAPVRGRRRPWLIPLGALLATLGALTVVWLVGTAGQRQEVLAIRTDVAYGQTLTADDITVARVSVDPGVTVLAASDRDLVVGQVATHPARARHAPQRADDRARGGAERGPGPGADRGSSRSDACGRPACGRPDPCGHAGSVAAEAGARGPTDATVVRVGPADINGVTVVDVTTAEAAGPALAIAAANGHVALVVKPSAG